MKTKYCEYCCVELLPDRKKLGKGSTKWLKCPKCQARLKENSTYYEEQEMEEFIKNKVRINLNNREDD